MLRTRIITAIVILILLMGNIMLGSLLYLKLVKLNQAERLLENQRKNTKILAFEQLFIDKVLLGEGTVSFDDRLKLENSVRDINDKEIFDYWQNFTNSKTDKDAQIQVGKMFSLLIKKLY